jgi:hypothetical protein
MENKEIKYGFVKGGLEFAVARDVTTRPEFNRSDYENLRPNERIPIPVTQQDYRDVMKACVAVYNRVGIVHSVVDLMSEFAAEGIEIIHPDKGPDQFYKTWSKKIKLEDRAERMASWLFKAGAVVVRRQFGVVPTSTMVRIREEIRNISPENLTDKAGDGRIPLQYLFYDPSTIEIIGDNLSALSKNKAYAIRVPLFNLRSARMKTSMDKAVLDGLPRELRDVLDGKVSKKTGGIYLYELKNDEIFVGHYKKDDTQVWGMSFIYSILEDVYYNQKVKMAKLGGLDGWYNTLRLWKIGDHKEKIFATPDEFSHLANIISQNTGGGSLDIIWPSTIEMEPFYPPIEKLQNFQENHHAILLGLGVPEGLVGGVNSQSSKGQVSNIGFKNLIKRVEAARRIIREWLEGEIDLVQKAMGFRRRPIIRFANEDLHDERTYFTLLKDLADRNIISEQTLLERLKESPEIESRRVADEQAARESDNRPAKTSPFHNPQIDAQREHELEKLRVQSENSNNLSKQIPVGETDNGRPPGSKDSFQRDRKPKNSAPVGGSVVLSTKIFDELYHFLTQATLKSNGFSSAREMSGDQKLNIEKIIDVVYPQAEAKFLAMTDEHKSEYIFSKLSNHKNELVNLFRERFLEQLAGVSVQDLTLDTKRIAKIHCHSQMGK